MKTTINATPSQDPNFLDDAKHLESLRAMTPDEIDQLAVDNIVEMVSMVQAALRADATLQPRAYDETDPSSIARVVIRWQLHATKTALERRDLANAEEQPAQHDELREQSAHPKRTNPMDGTHDSDLCLKKQNVIRVAGVPTGEQDDELQDFRIGLGGPALIRPSQLERYPGKTTVLFNVQELMGPSILYSFYQEGVNIELVVRNVRWRRQSDGRPFTSEVEAITLARCLHFHFCRFNTMEEAIILCAVYRNCSEKTLGFVGSPNAHRWSQSANERRSLATGLALTVSLPGHRPS